MIVHGLEQGVLNFVDGIGDLAMGVVGGIASAAGNTELADTMSNAINYDWQAQAIRAGDALQSSVWNAGKAIFDPNYTWQDYGKEWTDIGSAENSRERLNNEKYGTDLSDGAMDVISGVSSGIGQMLPSLALGGLGANALSGATGMSSRAAQVTTQASLGFVQGAGRGYGTVAEEGGDLATGSGYAALQGTMQGLEQGLSAFAGGTYSSKGANAVKGLSPNTWSDKIGETVTSKMADGMTKVIAKKGISVIADVAFDTAGEVLEEALDPVFKQITYDQNALYNAYGTQENFQATLERFGQVALTSALTSAIVDTVRAPGEVKAELAQNATNDIKNATNGFKEKAVDAKFEAETNTKVDTEGETNQEADTDIQDIRRQRMYDAWDNPEAQEKINTVIDDATKLEQAKKVAQDIGDNPNATQEQKDKAFNDLEEASKRYEETTQKAYNELMDMADKARNSAVNEVNVHQLEINDQETKAKYRGVDTKQEIQSETDLKKYVNPQAKRNKAVISEVIGGRETAILKARYKSVNDTDSGMVLSSTDTLGRGTKKGLQILSNTLRTNADSKIELEVDSRDLNIASDSDSKTKRLKFSNTSKPEDLEALISKIESDSTYKEYKAIIGNENVYEYEGGLALRVSKDNENIYEYQNSLILRVNKDTGEAKVELINKNDIDNAIEKDYTKLTNEEIDYEFRRIQSESRGLSDNEIKAFHSQSKEIDEGVRTRLSRIFEQRLGRSYSVSGNANGLLENTGDFKVYKGVDAETFHDIFEISQKYLPNGDTVDVHSVDDYKNATNYISFDGLSGFSITKDGGLISVYNLSDKRGWLRSISNEVRTNAKYLDCYNNDVQPLAKLYQKAFGFKVTSEMDFNYDILVSEKGKEYADYFVERYGESQVSFLVKTDEEVEIKHFTKDQYDEAVNYQQRFLNGDNINNTKTNTSNKNTDTFGQRNAQSRAELIKEAANDHYVTKKAVNSATDRIVKALNLGEDIKVDIKQETKDRLFASFGLDTDEDFAKARVDYLNELLDSKIKNEDGTESKLSDVFESEEAKAKWIEETDPILRSYIEEDAVVSKRGRENLEYKSKIDKLNSKVNELVARRNLAIKSLQLTNRIKKYNELTKTKPTAAAPDINPEATIQFKKLAPKIAVTQSGKGFSANTIVALVDADLKIDNEEIASIYNDLKTKIATTTEVTTDENGNVIEKTRREYTKINKNGETISSNAPTYDDQYSTYQVLDWLYKNEQGEGAKRLKQFKINTESARQEVKFLTEQQRLANKGNKALNGLSSLERDTRSPAAIFMDYLGENSQAYDLIVRKPIQAHRQLALFNDKANKFRAQAQQDFNISDVDLAKKVEWCGQKISRSILLEIYAETQSANLNDLLDNGFQFKDKKRNVESQVIKPTTEDLDALNNILTDNEKAYANKILKDGYNSLARQQLINYGQTHGLEIVNPDSDELYMHINRGNLRMNVGDNISNISSLGTGIFKERVKNRQPMYFNGIGEDFLTYMDSVGRSTLLDDVRDFNRVINLKADDNTSIANNFATNIQEGTKLLSEWQQRINGVDTGSSIGNSKLVANATVAPIVLNIGTWLTMLLDAYRVIQAVGYRDALKGVVKGIMASLTPSGRETINKIVSESGFYASMNTEHYSVASDTISANYNKVSKTLMKPIEAISNYMFKYMVTPMVEEHIATKYAGQEGYEVGGVKNIVEVRNWLDTNAQMFLSNSDKLDKSALRNGAGHGGVLSQLVFGLYGGDSQKWAESWHKVVFGNVDANRRIKGYQAMLEYLNTREEEINAQIDDIQSQIEDLDTEDANYEKNLNKLEQQLDDAQVNLESVAKSRTDAQTGIEVETEFKRTTPKRIAYLAGAFLMSACLEALINKGNAALKGREEDGEDYLTDIVENITYGWIPYINTFGNMVKYNKDVDMVQLAWLNQAKDTFASVKTWFDDKTEENGRSIAMNVAKSLGYLTGIPVDSIISYSNGVLKNFGAGTTAYQAYTYMNGYKSSYLNNQMSSARESGNDRDLMSAMEANMLMFKTGKPSTEVKEEMTRLYKNRFSVMPKDYKKDGYNSGQIENFRDIYYLSNDAVEEAISSSNYKSLDDTAKAKVIKKIYDAYYDGAEAVVDKTEAESKISKIIANTNGNLIIGKVAVIAYSATSASDIDKSNSLNASQKALAKYIAGFSLTDNEKSLLKNLFRKYGYANVVL